MTISARDWRSHPPLIYPGYKSTVLRGPTKPLIPLPETLSERTGPVFGHECLAKHDNDLTRNGRVDGAPIGERIIITGRVMGDDGGPIPDTLLEIWQTNAAGRYVHAQDLHDAPLDTNFYGAGRCVTDAAGGYRFTSIKPGAYPWSNTANAWRPAHIHFSLFGPSLATRLVTQMYFPNDPLLAADAIFNATADAAARDRLVAEFSFAATEADFALGYVFDIVLRGRAATPMED